ncbi:LysR substrate-binding domain-containing protein [Cupriavidus sp. CV2]|uniref:LysR family transcriptional regulator n=1 Tax=Cupriavidus ulmosensis TaxID=3065913 RepID=UPI00296AC7F9|nr:LysR substrate-binding domain-containing protein [Cupriavidus sp. CV2]MDW3685186.1 LysR substrate-binding domain-containing protein [Cupriavidus sp. CV2]
MNLRAIDLNLLTVLDALLDEAHVSRAAQRVGLSQPAASSALERCRHLFKDRLLERAPGGMQLTPKAQALRAPLKLALASVAAVIGAPEVDLASLSQTVRVRMADHPAVLVARQLHRQLAASAPGLNLVLQPWQGADAALDALARGDSDLAVSVFPAPGSDFRRRPLLREHYVVAMRRGHPASRDFTLARWLDYPHVLVSGRGDIQGPLDDALAGLGLARRVGMVVPSFMMVPPLLADSDLIAMLPSRCLPEDPAQALATFAPPVAVEGFSLHLAWHVRRDDDVAVRHVAGLIEGLLAA